MADFIYFPFIFLPAVLALTGHEFAHGWVALQLGDPTAADNGRLSLNPLRHIDRVGTVLVPVTLYAVGLMAFGRGMFFGWAKPVPVAWELLQPIRPGIAAVAAAGPGANLVMLTAWAVVGLIFSHCGVTASVLLKMCEAGIIFNAAIMVINLIPIPPLDGSRIVTAALPQRWALRYNRLEPFGIFLVIALVAALSASGLMEVIVLKLYQFPLALGILGH